jgi:hypothetical protein
MYLLDGYQILVAFALDPNIQLWEKSVTPPGVDGGGPIEVATMRNSSLRTRAPKHLVTVTEMTMVCAFHPEVYDEFYAIMQQIQATIITFPNGTAMTIFGWVDKFMPAEFTEGNMPTANVTFYPSMMTAAYQEDPWTIV